MKLALTIKTLMTKLPPTDVRAHAKEPTRVSLLKQGVGSWGLRSTVRVVEQWDGWLWKNNGAENPTSSSIAAYGP